MNYTQARAILDSLLAAWPHTDMPAETVQTWVKMLRELPHDESEAAADACIRSSNYFPTIARFREALAGANRDQKSEWTATDTCPVCAGIGMVSDGDGRDWLCRCAAFERKPKVHNAVTAPPPELLEAARRTLKRLPKDDGS